MAFVLVIGRYLINFGWRFLENRLAFPSIGGVCLFFWNPNVLSGKVWVYKIEEELFKGCCVLVLRSRGLWRSNIGFKHVAMSILCCCPNWRPRNALSSNGIIRSINRIIRLFNGIIQFFNRIIRLLNDPPRLLNGLSPPRHTPSPPLPPWRPRGPGQAPSH